MNKKVLTAIISSAAVVVIGGVLATVLYVLPKSHYDKGSDLYRSGSYGAAKTEFDAAGNFRDAKDCAVAADKQQALLDGNTAMVNGEYEKACELFTKAGEYDLNGSNLKLAEEMITGSEADKLIEEGKYIEAYTTLKDAKYSQPDKDSKLIKCIPPLIAADDLDNAYLVSEFMDDGKAQRFYVEGLQKYNEGKYELAKGYFSETNYLDSKDYAMDCTYNIGIQKFESGAYHDALESFNQINLTYKDTKDYVEKSQFMTIGEYIAKGDYITAQEYLGKVDENFELNDVKASDFKAQIDKYSDYLRMCDNWKYTDGKIKSEEKWSYYSSWWELEGDDLRSTVSNKNVSLDISFMVNEDGTVTISGSTQIIFFKDYSSVRALLDIEQKTYKFSETVKSSSGSIKVTDEVTLKYGKDKCTVSYRKEDTPYAGCKDIMTSEFVFEHK